MANVPTHFGRYRVLQEIGRGAMGVVYLAEDETLQRQVAVKTLILSDDAAERADHEARFRQEAKAAGGLSHPNIVTIHDLGREGDWLYISMELLRGLELRDLMVQGTLTLPLAVDIASQVASGLAAAHARGVVHRDIKPSNIMVIDGRHAKIMDFGVARMQSSEVKTQAGVMLGSPKYMSPEQVEGRPADHRSDIFSLGSMLYEMTTGAPPFQGKDLGGLLFDIVRAQPVPASQRNAAVPPMLDLILARAMRKDPADRYQDAGEFARDLEQCALSLAGPGLDAPRAAPPAAPAMPVDPFAATRIEPSPAAAHGGAAADRTLVQPRQTVVVAPAEAGEPPAAPPRVSEPERTATRSAGIAAAEAGLGIAREIDSADAMARLLNEAGTRTGRTRAKPRPPRPQPWGWYAAYAVAVIAALWIALG